MGESAEQQPGDPLRSDGQIHPFAEAAEPDLPPKSAQTSNPALVPAWKPADVVIGLAAGLLATIIAGVAVAATVGESAAAPEGIGGYLGRVTAQLAIDAQPDAPGLSLSQLMILQAALWLGLLGVPLYLIWRRGQRFVPSLALGYKGSDIPLGLLLGVGAQFAIGWLIYLPLSPFIDSYQLSEPARLLSDKANNPLGMVLLIVIVLIGAPFCEEIFYRGVVYGTLRHRLSAWLSVAVSGLLFALVHFQLLQLPGLLAFGVLLAILYEKTKRLWLPIWTHLGFNAVTVLSLLTLS